MRPIQRERPFFQQACRCSVRFEVSGVNHQSGCGAILLNKLSENFVKEPQPAPADKAVVKRLVWPILGRGVFPLQAVLDDINDPADDAPVINSRNTMRPGKVALDTGNLGARKIKKFLHYPLLEPTTKTFYLSAINESCT